MEDWKNMLLFAIEVIRHSLEHRNGNITDQRIAITNLDHATELMLKAFLIKEGYLINEIDKKKIRNKGISNIKVRNILDNERTIGFYDTSRLVFRIIRIEPEKKTKITRFHKIRNEIQHRALNLPINKEEEIERFFPVLRELYVKMFPEYENHFPGEQIY